MQDAAGQVGIDGGMPDKVGEASQNPLIKGRGPSGATPKQARPVAAKAPASLT